MECGWMNHHIVLGDETILMRSTVREAVRKHHQVRVREDVACLCQADEPGVALLHPQLRDIAYEGIEEWEWASLS